MLNIIPQARFERHRAQGYGRGAHAALSWHDIRDLAAVQQAAPSAKSSFIWQYLAFLTLVASLLLASMFPAAAQQRIINPGDAVVTGFSGIAPNGMAFGPGVDPLDGFFINLDGPSAQIMSLGGITGAARGQLVAAPALFQLTARQIGQVFAAALDDGLGGKTPNIYLGATSLFGIHIAMPDSNGDGLPERLKTGNANARWMAGQFGPGAEPGAIWRVNGETGAVEQFTTLPGNSGPGVGDVVYDARHRQFFASDVDTGLIYRIGESGNIIDSFDHGLSGRPNQGLAPVGDDGVMMDITSPAFDTQDPASWGYTQSERQVWGMAVHGGRLYYALKDGLQVWSVGIARGGRFKSDARWELDAKELPASGAITDMTFDNAGRIYLAQRGSPRGSYDYSVFATPGRSSVARYAKETPDNPATPGIWKPIGEGYAIGMTPPHLQANGGLALGYAHGATGAMRPRSCSATLWATGSRLTSSAGVGPGAEADVHGLQSTPLNKVGLANVPPTNSYFVDYDGLFGDAAKAGHMGDIEIWQPCNRGFTRSGALPPGYVPPAKVPPQDFPPDYPPPHREFTTNLKLTKRAAPKTCTAYMGGWACRYQVRVRNMGPEAYFGPILINDTLPSAPAGAFMGFAPAASWNCWAVGAASYNCHRPGVFLAPGASVELTVYVGVPHDYPKCQVQNIASLTWAPGGTRWNTDPTDDVDSATALIPSVNCPPPEGKTNLKIEKEAAGQACENIGEGARCTYRITVTNTGANVYHGEIHITEQPVAGTSASFSAGLWNCVDVGGSYNCVHPNTTLNPGEQRFLWVLLDVPLDVARENKCKIDNLAMITFAPGGSAQNTNPGDDSAAATAIINGGQLCYEPRRVLQKKMSFKCPPGYAKSGNRCVQKSGRCPVGWSKTPVRGKCCPAGKPWNGQTCGRQTTETPPTKQPPRREPPSYTPPTLVPPPYTPPTRKLCPRGTYGTYPRCRPNRTPPKVCPQGTHGIYPRCIPNRTTPQFCPKGTTGIYPLCIPTRQPPQACPKGYHGKSPRCIRDTRPPQQCPQGMRGKAPNCYPITEPGGNSNTNPGQTRPGLKRPAVKWPGLKRPNGKRPGVKRPSFRLPNLGNRKGTTPGLRRPSKRRPILKRVPNFRAPLTRTPGTKGKTIYNPNLRKSKTRNTNGRKRSYRKTAPRSSNTPRLPTLKPKRSIRHKLNLGRSSKRSAPRARTLSRSAAAKRNVRGNTRKPAVRTQRKAKKKSKKVLRLRFNTKLLGQ